MNLRLDWCSTEAAQYAVEHWHYAETFPRGKTAKVGVWESERFIGSVVYARGNGVMGNAFGLDQTAVAELSRVALTRHCAPVSRIVGISNRLLKQAFPGLRLLVSYADPVQDHVGGIYQAMNWVYVGLSAADVKYIDQTGRAWHSRNISEKGYKIHFGRPTRAPKVSECIAIQLPPKHKYMLPLDAAMRAQILPLARPYPKRAPEALPEDATANQAGEGGAAPTSALQLVRA